MLENVRLLRALMLYFTGRESCDTLPELGSINSFLWTGPLDRLFLNQSSFSPDTKIHVVGYVISSYQGHHCSYDVHRLLPTLSVSHMSTTYHTNSGWGLRDVKKKWFMVTPEKAAPVTQTTLSSLCRRTVGSERHRYATA